MSERQRKIEEINEELTMLNQNKKYAQGERREQIQRRISYLAFECSEITRESHGVSIEEAWHNV